MLLWRNDAVTRRREARHGLVHERDGRSEPTGIVDPWMGRRRGVNREVPGDGQRSHRTQAAPGVGWLLNQCDRLAEPPGGGNKHAGAALRYLVLICLRLTRSTSCRATSCSLTWLCWDAVISIR